MWSEKGVHILLFTIIHTFVWDAFKFKSCLLLLHSFLTWIKNRSYWLFFVFWMPWVFSPHRTGIWCEGQVCDQRHWTVHRLTKEDGQPGNPKHLPTQRWCSHRHPWLLQVWHITLSVYPLRWFLFQLWRCLMFFLVFQMLKLVHISFSVFSHSYV